jgi:hypothetical protein
MAGTTTALCTSFKGELLKAGHNLDAAGNSLKMALIKVTPTGTYGAASTNYTNITGNSDEVSGTGYTATGAAVTNSGVSTSGTTGIADFGNVTWSTATFSATATMLYNTTASGKAIALWDFGGTQSVTASTFTITMPASGASTSLIRIA